MRKYKLKELRELVRLGVAEDITHGEAVENAAYIAAMGRNW